MANEEVCFLVTVANRCARTFTSERLQLELWLVAKKTKWIALQAPFQFFIEDKNEVHIAHSQL